MTFHIHQSCTHIYLIYTVYIYLHTLLFCSERGKTILQNMYLWWPDCSFFLSLPFMVYAKHSGLKRGEKSDDPLSFKSNHVNEDVSFYRRDESMKDSCLFVFLV